MENKNEVLPATDSSSEDTMKTLTLARINEVLNKSGRFQIALLLLISINSAIVAYNHTLPTFHSYTPRFFCRDNIDNATEGCVGPNETCEAGYEFESDDNTLVSEWELVCSRVLLKPMVSTFYYSGVTVGSIVFGILADKYGRYLTMVVCLYTQCIFGLSLFAAETLNTFIVLRTIQGIFIQGLQTTSFALLLELCSSHHRTALGVFWDISWSIGCTFLGSMAFIVIDWRWLQIVLSVPSILTLFYIWIIPESPSWLVSIGKYKEAQKICEKISRLNGHQEQTEQNGIAITNVFPNTENESSTHRLEERRNLRSDMLAILKSKLLRKFGLIMMFTWFSVTLAYFGLLFYIPNLYGQRHINFIIGAGIEAVSFIISYWIMVRFGRKNPMIIYQYMTGILCGIAALIIYTPGDSNTIVGTSITVLILLGKGCAVSSFCIMYIYVIELFPTTVRGAALGICGFWSRLGSLLSPQIIVLGEGYTHPALPVILIGVFNCISGFLCSVLPETRDTKLVNNVEESEQMFDIKKVT